MSFSIRIRPLLLLGLTFILMLGMLTYFAFIERREHLAEAMADVQATAERISRDQDRVIQYARQLVAVLTQTHDLRAFATTAPCDELLAQLLKDDPRLANINIVAPNGDSVCDATQTPRPVNIADRVHFQKALASTDLVIEKAVVSKSTGKWSLPFAKAIRDDAGHVQAVLTVLVDLAWVNRELGKANYPAGARLGLIDRSGTVLARYPDPENWVGKDASHTPFFETLIAHGGTGTGEAPGFDGVGRIYGFAHFAETTAGPIYLWVGLSKESIMANVDRKFAWTLSATFLLLALTFGVIWIAEERLLLRPIAALANAARRLGQGDHNARTGLRHTGDELGQLTRTFDEMAEALMSTNEILQLNRALRVLSSCNAALIRATSEEQLLHDVCRLIVEVGGYRMTWVGFAQRDDEKSVRPVAQFGYEEGYLDTVRITWADSERGHGPTGTAIRTGTPQVNQDFSANPLLAPWRSDALKRGYQSSMALPLKNDSGVFGALTIYSAEPEAFSEAEAQLLQELANDLAFGIVTLRIRVTHNEDVARLERSMEATIQAVATAVEIRDPYTGGHQRHVAALAVAIARELRLSEDETHGIRLAAAVHDIGKIRVAAEILARPGHLSEVEYRLIKETHVRAGYDILKDIDFPWPIAQLVLQHHERVNGSGYPGGLKGDEILLGAKILAVADTVEAMASHRPYRPSVGIDAALTEVRMNRGTLYEPAVADACERLFSEGRFAFPA